ncbi:MAG: Hsp70 family protein [Rhizonema sp. PD38]|nr:Hsp70 family protein [Rhizonema sp. PD38]
MRAIAIWESETEKVRVLCNQEGDRLTPSVVMFDTQTNQSIVAKSALSSIISHLGQVIYSVKRFIGCIEQGEQLGYENLTNYICHRDGYTCQNPNCKNKSAEKVLQVHYLGYWKNPSGRSNRLSNLIKLCDIYLDLAKSFNYDISAIFKDWRDHHAKSDKRSVSLLTK